MLSYRAYLVTHIRFIRTWDLTAWGRNICAGFWSWSRQRTACPGGGTQHSEQPGHLPETWRLRTGVFRFRRQCHWLLCPLETPAARKRMRQLALFALTGWSAADIAIQCVRVEWTDDIQDVKKSLCTWWLQYRKLQVMFKVSPASLQTFIDKPKCVLEDRVQYSTVRVQYSAVRVQYTNYVIMISDWNCLTFWYRNLAFKF
jgi:hypothetical protein